jgi:hypothetical protein
LRQWAQAKTVLDVSPGGQVGYDSGVLLKCRLLSLWCRSRPSGPCGSELSPSDWGNVEPRGARLGVAGKTAVASCMAGPLSAPNEGEVTWRGVRRGVAENVDRSDGSELLPPSLPGWGGGKHGCRRVGTSPSPLERRGLLSMGVSSELTGVSSELTGVSSELTGVSSKLTGL